MKKTLAILSISIAFVSCNKPAEQAPFKTAYVDTEKLMDESTEMKDLTAKYKAKEEEMSKGLEAEAKRFEQERAAFMAKAQQLGQVWAQQNSAPLQRKAQQLQYAQDELLRRLQSEVGVEQDSAVSRVKKFLKQYGKKEGYDYIYGTGVTASVLYAKEQYDITKDVIKALNENYSKEGKTEAPAADQAKAETKPEEKK